MNVALTIKLSDEVRERIDRLAREQGVSVEDFVAAAAAEKAGAVEEAAAYFAERTRRAKPGAAGRFFRQEAGDEPARKGDERA